VKRAFGFTCRAALLAVALSSAAFAQNVLSGTWTIQPEASGDKIQLQLRYQLGNEDGRFQDSHDFSIESLGLRAGDLTSAPHSVQFTLRRDAGVVDFTGTIGDGVGAGHYTFAPSSSYPDAIASRGIERPDAQAQLIAALLDASLSYADGMIAAGLRPSSFDKFIAFRALRITPDSVRNLRRAFGPMNEDDVITFTALRITPEYAAQMRAQGLTDLDAHTLVSLKALHVDAAYIRELASLGYDRLSAHDLTELKALHVDADYIRRVESHGYKHPSIHQLVELKALRII
jgi:hypothetical protein